VPFTDAQALRNYFDDTKSVELVDGNKYKVKSHNHVLTSEQFTLLVI